VTVGNSVHSKMKILVFPFFLTSTSMCSVNFLCSHLRTATVWPTTTVEFHNLVTGNPGRLLVVPQVQLDLDIPRIGRHTMFYRDSATRYYGRNCPVPYATFRAKSQSMPVLRTVTKCMAPNVIWLKTKLSWSASRTDTEQSRRYQRLVHTFSGHRNRLCPRLTPPLSLSVDS
jgi:hypothetical protein